MSGVPSLPDNFGGMVRLFPLPNLVLFPHVVQPLHIFEPRYRQLMADALQDDRLIAMATLKPDWEAEYHHSPAIHPVVCIGRIYKEEALPDGRYHLLLHGLCRARIREELRTDRLYRTAHVDILEDVPVSSKEVEQELTQKLSECLRAWFATQSATLTQLGKLLESGLTLGALCDVFSFTLNMEVEVKQQLLEQIDVEGRARRLLEFLGPRLHTKLTADSSSRFPPDFSVN